jgi:sterol desaturase/sphingolipid hydroxylase (fatty acid hydroxylase superfamily)
VPLLDQLAARATTTEVVLALSYAAVVVAGLGEALWLASTSGRARIARFPAAAAMGAGGLAAGAAVTVAYTWIWPVLHAAAPPGAAGLWADHPVLGAAVAFVAWDAAGYAYHRLGHGTRVGWAAHQVHHTGTTYDLSLAWRQTWLPVHAVCVFPLVALLGVSLSTAAICAAISNTWQALLHTSYHVRVPGPVAGLVMTPAVHRRHHCTGGAMVNLGPVLTVWDRLGGTWDPAPADPTARCGIDGRPDLDGAVLTELAGWRALLRAGARV